jgi:hypothetical protein
MRMNRIAKVLGLSLLLALTGCSEEGTHNRGVYMLMDTSGTYTQELEKAQHIINYILAKLQSNDSFAVARVDTGSFSEKDIVAKITFDSRPSNANQQKLAFRDTINQFVKTVKSSSYTDITGGILQATEYLNEKGTSKKTILIFSDLKEELKKGFIRDIPLQLNGFEVVALNVTKLRSDNVDPREYMNRLEEWKAKVESGGGTWRVINDLERLDNMFN